MSELALFLVGASNVLVAGRNVSSGCAPHVDMAASPLAAFGLSPLALVYRPFQIALASVVVASLSCVALEEGAHAPPSRAHCALQSAVDV